MASLESITTDVAIIGAGLTGLTLAYKLAGKKEFTVIEQNDCVGGVIETKEKNGFRYELGPNSGTTANEETDALIQELGGVVFANEASQKRYILKNGKWHAIPSGPVSAIKTPLFTFTDKLRLLGEPFRRKQNDPNETLANFVKRRMGQSFLDYAIDPFVSGVYAGDPNELIVRHAFPAIYNLEQNYGSLIKGAIGKRKEAKRSGKQPVKRKIFSYEGGLGGMTRALYEKAGKGNFHLNATIRDVQVLEQGFRILMEKGNEQVRIQCRQLVSTVQSHAIPQVLPFLEEKHLRGIDNLDYAPVTHVAVGFNRWEGRPLDGFGGLIPSKEKRDILGILFMSTLFDDRAPKEGALLNVFLGGMRNPDIKYMTDQSIRQTVAREVSDLMDLEYFDPDLFEIKRYPAAIPQYTITTDARMAAIGEVEKEYPNLIIAGNAKDGIGIPNRVKQAVEVAERLIGKA